MALELNRKKRTQPVLYTKGEEVANAVTHGVGAGLSVAACVVLVVLAAGTGDAWTVVSFSIYGVTLMLMYVASTLYHSIRSPRVKPIFRILDHIAIYLLIAGTYTPFALINLRGGWGWSLFGILWGLALIGAIFKVSHTGRMEIFSTAVYVAMGWLVLIALKPALDAIDRMGILWLLIGGCAYTLGLIFYAWGRLPYNHAIWHVFVMGGRTCHFFAVLLYTEA